MESQYPKRLLAIRQRLLNRFKSSDRLSQGNFLSQRQRALTPRTPKSPSWLRAQTRCGTPASLLQNSGQVQSIKPDGSSKDLAAQAGRVASFQIQLHPVHPPEMGSNPASSSQYEFSGTSVHRPSREISAKQLLSRSRNRISPKSTKVSIPVCQLGKHQVSLPKRSPCASSGSIDSVHSGESLKTPVNMSTPRPSKTFTLDVQRFASLSQVGNSTSSEPLSKQPPPSFEAPKATEEQESLKQQSTPPAPIPIPDPSKVPLLKIHHQKYQLFSRAKLGGEEDSNSIEAVTEYLACHRIHCLKYNYSLEACTQNFSSFQAYLQYDEQADEVVIINRKPVDLVEHALEKDEEDLREKNRSLRNQKRTQENQVEEDYCPTELDENLDSVLFKESRSSGSCKVADIQGFIFGGQSSRFWMLRKHINSCSDAELKNLPFYSWNCLTLQLEHRDIDLVIRNEDHMRKLIKFLVYRIQTIDGARGSGKAVVDKLIEETLTSIPRSKLTSSPRASRQRIRRECERKVFDFTCFRFLVLCVRNKISYSAFVKKMSIQELITRTILNSFNKFVEAGLIQLDAEKERAAEQIIPSEKETFDENLRYFVLNSSAKELMNINFLNLDVEHQERLKEQPVSKTAFTVMNQLFDKDNVIDIFREVRSGDELERVNWKRYVEYKFLRKTRRLLLQRLRLILGLKLLGGSLFLKAVLKRIELSKKLFILEVEQGQEVYVLNDLSQRQYPYGFRYYDFLFTFIQESLSADKKEFYGLKKGLALSIHSKSRNSLFDAVFPAALEESKLVFQHKVVGKVQRKEIDFLASKHTMGVQRSNYVVIDNDVDDDRLIPDESSRFQSVARTVRKPRPRDVVNTVNIKNCEPREVARNMHAFLKMKTIFAQKQAHIKSLGQKQLVLKKVIGWLEASELKNDPEQKAKLFAKAESLVKERRCRLRQKQVEKLSDVMKSSNFTYDAKTAFVDGRIEYDFKFFGSISDEAQRKYNRLQAESKKVEKLLAKRTLSQKSKFGKLGKAATMLTTE